jgi:pyridoxamine 5'-phosphate oxidase family protein
MWGKMLFTPSELEFLRSQRIGRFATVSTSGWPHVMPVMYSVDDEGALEFDVDGVKLRNIQAEPRASMVVDAMGPRRGVSIQGQATLIAPERARLDPVRKFSWGL